jgi:transcriptional regulator with XRE-family HTH domain
MIEGSVARDLRVLAGLTMEEAAREAGIDARTVFRFERGETRKPDTARRIAKVLRAGLERRSFAIDAARMKLETVPE